MVFKSLKETKSFLKKFVKILKEELKKKRSLILLFQGHLGAGKTTFIKEIAKNLGIKEIIKSPTFILWQIYRFKLGNNTYHFHHLDLYRVNAQAILHLNFTKKIKEKNNIFAIEWGEKLEGYLKRKKIKYIKFQIEKIGKKRKIILSFWNFKNAKKNPFRC